MEEQPLRAIIGKDSEIWISATDVLTNLDVAIARYRAEAKRSRISSVILKMNAFADALQAERDDLATALEDVPPTAS